MKQSVYSTLIIFIEFYLSHTFFPLELVKGFAKWLLAFPSLSVFIEWKEYEPKKWLLVPHWDLKYLWTSNININNIYLTISLETKTFD